MQLALDLFSRNFSRVRNLHLLHGIFSSQVTDIIDLDDILRAEIVLSVSALDHYIHEATRIGMMDCWRGIRTKTDSFKKFTISLDITLEMLTDKIPVDTLIESEIKIRHSYLAFQRPDKIADAIRMFSAVSVWKEVSVLLGISEQSLKSSLGLIVDRRNKIAHEADLDPSFPGQTWPIDRPLVDDMLTTIDQIVRGIHQVIAPIK